MGEQITLFSKHNIQDFFEEIILSLDEELANYEGEILSKINIEELCDNLIAKYTLQYPKLAGKVSDPKFDNEKQEVIFTIPFIGDKKFFEAKSKNNWTNSIPPKAEIGKEELIFRFSISTKPISLQGVLIPRMSTAEPTPENIKRWPYDRLKDINQWLNRFSRDVEEFNNSISTKIKNHIYQERLKYKQILKHHANLKEALGIKEIESKVSDSNTSIKQEIKAENNSSVSDVIQVSGSINNSNINIRLQPSKTSNTLNTQDPSMAEYKISQLTKIQLIKLIEDKLNRIEVKLIWLQLFNSNMDDELPNRVFSDCIMELHIRAEKRNKLSEFYQALIQSHPDFQKLQNSPSPTTNQSFSQPQSSINHNLTSERKNMNKIKILFLAANPDNTVKLNLDNEFRDIKEKIKLSPNRDSFDIIHQPALRINDLQAALLEHNPNIVHFSGHGNNAGKIILENNQGCSEAVNPTALAELFEILSGKIRCIVLNACFSEPQAQAISQHIDCVVGMSDSISDSAAIDFAWSFYQSLANDQDIHTSFRLGCNQLSFHNISEKNVPQLLSKPGVDPKSIKLSNF